MSEPRKRKATPKAAEPIIDLHNDDFGMMLNCAVRNACSRQSYMPGAVRRYITPLLPYLSSKTLWCDETPSVLLIKNLDYGVRAEIADLKRKT